MEIIIRKTPLVIEAYEAEDLVDNFHVTDLKKISIVFEYPLAQPVGIEFEREEGFRAIDILQCVAVGYQRIYAQEEAAVGHPGHGDVLVNRKTSAGPHGIWGHDIGELYFEGFEEIEPGKFSLQIGS